MTVRELRELLADFPDDMEVCHYDSTWDFLPIDSVYIVVDGPDTVVVLE
jgi:hypothetical protein